MRARNPAAPSVTNHEERIVATSWVSPANQKYMTVGVGIAVTGRHNAYSIRASQKCRTQIQFPRCHRHHPAAKPDVGRAPNDNTPDDAIESAQ
jgi:hypothetical protein